MTKFSTLILACLIFAIISFILSGQISLHELNRMEKDVSILEAEATKMKVEIQRLETMIAKTASDANFLETTAREELALSSPGEIVYLFSDR